MYYLRTSAKLMRSQLQSLWQRVGGSGWGSSRGEWPEPGSGEKAVLELEHLSSCFRNTRFGGKHVGCGFT